MSALKSIFHAEAYKEVGDVYRDRLGGSPFPIERDEPPVEKWVCPNDYCTYWKQGERMGGKCAGMCAIG